jgi:LPS O-antigen subunit length determinant protein (WzzB/FepE family)
MPPMRELFERAWTDRRVILLIAALGAVVAGLNLLLMRFETYQHLVDAIPWF